MERYFNEMVDGEMSKNDGTVKDGIQNAILTVIDSIVAPKIEIAISSEKTSSGRNAAIVTANSERGEHVGISAVFENASENKYVLHLSNVNDESRNNIMGGVCELSVPGTRFDRQTHTHYNNLPRLITRTVQSHATVV